MRPLPITFAASALRDLQHLRAWFDEQDARQAGDRLLREILRQIDDLAIHPDRGRIVPEFGRTAVRELVHPPFRIVYRRDPERIRVVRIWRGERILRIPDD